MNKLNHLNTAIKNLLKASAALDTVNMVNGSILSLKLASLVADAKEKTILKTSILNRFAQDYSIGQIKVDLLDIMTQLSIITGSFNKLSEIRTSRDGKINVYNIFPNVGLDLHDTFKVDTYDAKQLNQLANKLYESINSGYQRIVILNGDLTTSPIMDLANREDAEKDLSILRVAENVLEKLLPKITSVKNRSLHLLDLPGTSPIGTTPIGTTPISAPPPVSGKPGTIDPQHQYNLNFFLIGKIKGFVPLGIDGLKGSLTMKAIAQAKEILDKKNMGDDEFLEYLKGIVSTMPGYGKGGNSKVLDLGTLLTDSEREEAALKGNLIRDPYDSNRDSIGAKGPLEVATSPGNPFRGDFATRDRIERGSGS